MKGRKMHQRMSGSARVCALVGAMVIAGACAKGDGGRSDTTAMLNDSAKTADSGVGAMNNAPPAPAMSDADILGAVAAVNQGEVDAGNAAAKKGTKADTKAFAKEMVADHGKMKADGDALAKAKGWSVTPNDSVVRANKATMDSVGAKTGADFDKAYAASQVAGHQAALGFLQRASGLAQDSTLRKMLNDAQPKVQMHLDKAKALQSKVGGP